MNNLCIKIICGTLHSGDRAGGVKDIINSKGLNMNNSSILYKGVRGYDSLLTKFVVYFFT